MGTSIRNGLVLLAFVSLAACGGGGGGSTGAGPVPATPTPTPTTAPTSTPATSLARVTISDPVGPSTFGAARRPRHLPFSTVSITISVNGGPASSFPYHVNGPTCVTDTSTTTCTFDVQVPTGNDTLVVQALNAAGKPLATATVQQAISGTTVVPVTLLGVPANAIVTLASNTAPAGTLTAIPITLTAKDADGNTIIGTYATPVTLTNDDKSGHTTISPNPVVSSSTAVALNYDGGASNARISASFTGAASALFASAVAAHEYAIPSGTLAASNAGTGTIVLGGDGAMWFGEQNGVGRIDANGAITEYPMVQPQVMVRGADGAVWFTTAYDSATGHSGELVRVAADGTATKLNVAIGAKFVLGSDGNFWDVNGSSYVKRVTPSGTVTTFPLTSPPGALISTVQAHDIVALPDGNLLVLDYYNLVAYTVSTSGNQVAATQMSPGKYLATGGSNAIIGPDSAVWYIGQNEIVRYAGAGAITEYNQFPGTLTYSSGYGNASPLLAGPDGNVWATGTWLLNSTPTFFRISPSTGAILALPAPSTGRNGVGQPPSIVGAANGPNNTIWYVRGSNVGKFAPPN
ncbi:MAG TPA: hypothetical protein VHS78_10200 [Candidatus Elarobacter sp.]|nr:hypothetical protein [Candidatus Elarobacter sp.]